MNSRDDEHRFPNDSRPGSPPGRRVPSLLDRVLWVFGLGTYEQIREPDAAASADVTARHDASEAPPDAPATPTMIPARRGPGLLEAVAWIVGLMAVEVAVPIAWGVALLAVEFATGRVDPRSLSQEQQVGLFRGLIEANFAAVIGTTKTIEIVLTLLAMRLRYGRNAFRVFGFDRFPILHAVLVALAVLPTAIFCGNCFQLFSAGWDSLIQLLPNPDLFRLESSMDTVQKMAKSTPLAVLWLIIAVAPAINEELFFRAALGRGFLARYGLGLGITLTSLLFAAAHLNPPHVASLVPLAVLLHVAYYSSGSFWLPVLLHFLNNGLAVSQIKETALKNAEPTAIHWPLFIGAGAVVVSVCWLLATLKLRYRLPGGEVWRPNFTSVEPPPAELGAVRFRPSPPPAAVAATCVAFALFIGGVTTIPAGKQNDQLAPPDPVTAPVEEVVQ